MGAFLLTRRDPDDTDREVASRTAAARAVLAHKGFRPGTILSGPTFHLEILPKLNQDAPQVLDLGEQGFLACTGTLLYRGRYGKAALEALHRDSSGDWSLLDSTRGNYCLIVQRDGALHLATDVAGLYPVYVDRQRGVVSNSFLAVHRAAASRKLRAQETYEFVFIGAFHAEQTPIEDIERAPSGVVIGFPELDAGRSYASLEPPPGAPGSKRMEDWVAPVHQGLQTVLADVTAAFDDDICSALSGGFDSRLLLAHLRSQGHVPRYLYVYGRDGDPDVRVARHVAAAEGFELNHVPTPPLADRDLSGFVSDLRNNFYLFDGLGTTISGVLQTDVDLQGRRDRTARATLQLNGGGGEIYRDFWKLPDRALSPEAFVGNKYDSGDYPGCTDAFSRREYLVRLAAKVRAVSGVATGRLPRPTVEALYPLWRLRYWQALNNAINNQFAYALTPFCEPELTRQSFVVPMALKHGGLLEAALIASCDRELARHRSAYGFDFLSGPTRKSLLKESAVRSIPIRLRPALRRWKSRRQTPSMPAFLRPEYVVELLGPPPWGIHEYVDPFALTDPHMRSRALGLELLQRPNFFES